MSELLSPSEVQSALPGWRVLATRVHAVYATGSFVTGVELVGRIAELAEAANHHPDVDLRYGTVQVSLISHDANGLTGRDVRLAEQISGVAAELGIEADLRAPQVVEIAVDALDIPAVVPFWRAVLGYVDEKPPAPDAQPALVDSAGVGPAVWFQPMDRPRPQRNRLHVDVFVAHDLAAERVAAALEAGGTLRSDASAPSFWVLADAEGNEVCVCTWQPSAAGG